VLKQMVHIENTVLSTVNKTSENEYFNRCIEIFSSSVHILSSRFSFCVEENPPLSSGDSDPFHSHVVRNIFYKMSLKIK
jgi:hypothetical protein